MEQFSKGKAQTRMYPISFRSNHFQNYVIPIGSEPLTLYTKNRSRLPVYGLLADLMGGIFNVMQSFNSVRPFGQVGHANLLI